MMKASIIAGQRHIVDEWVGTLEDILLKSASKRRRNGEAETRSQRGRVETERTWLVGGGELLSSNNWGKAFKEMNAKDVGDGGRVASQTLDQGYSMMACSLR